MSIPQSGGGPIEHHSQLAEYMAEGCKPKSDWKIGTEHEKFGYCKDSLLPIPYEGERSVRAVLEGLQQKHGWNPVFEGENIVGLEKDGANVSLEPGGQLELSGAPLDTIHQTCDEVNIHLKEVKDIADAVGVGFIGLGAAPIWTHEQMPLMPKGRYKLMNDYMQKVGTMGRDMMRRTCTVPVLPAMPSPLISYLRAVPRDPLMTARIPFCKTRIIAGLISSGANSTGLSLD